jgi:hypothetical protein
VIIAWQLLSSCAETAASRMRLRRLPLSDDLVELRLAELRNPFFLKKRTERLLLASDDERGLRDCGGEISAMHALRSSAQPLECGIVDGDADLRRRHPAHPTTVGCTSNVRQPCRYGGPPIALACLASLGYDEVRSRWSERGSRAYFL